MTFFARDGKPVRNGIGSGVRRNSRRRAAAAVVVVLMIPVLLGFAALTVDVGVMYSTRADLQRSADAGALAAASAYSRLTAASAADRLAASRATGLGFVETNKVLGSAVTLDTATDILFGKATFNASGTELTFTPGESDPNAVRITVRKTSDSPNGPLDLFFAGIFGVRHTDVSASAMAGFFPPKFANVVPLSLRAPSFGPVDPEISGANPGKDGPSDPANGESFQIGEEVTVFTFGKGPRSPVHLVLDMPTSNGVSDIDAVLEGTQPGIPMAIGDEFHVFNEGTGNGGFGGKVENRLEDTDPDNDIIVVPILETLPTSRNADGELSGKVRVVDFATIRLIEVREVEVPKPSDPTHLMTIRILVGVVIESVGGIGHDPGGSSGQFTEGSLVGSSMLIQ